MNTRHSAPTDARVARLINYIHSLNAAAARRLLLRIAGWFSGLAEAEFWDAVDYLTLGERGIEEGGAQ